MSRLTSGWRRTPGLGLLVAVTAAWVALATAILLIVITAGGPTWVALAICAVGGVVTVAIVGVVGWAVLQHPAQPSPGVDHADSSFAAQRRLLDDVRHELKTPITIVRGHLEVMDAADSDDVAAIRAIGIAELDRMTRLIGDIDLLAAVETDRFSFGTVDLAALTQRLSEMVTVIPGHSWAVEQTAEGAVRGDRDRLLQAWLALADNAAKYTPEGTTIRIGSALHASGAQLWVRDHGPGIPPAMRHRIFRRFDRGGGKRTVGGSGLGLAIVDAIAKAHGGHCAIADTPGGGATFTLEIPIGTEAALPAPVRAGDVLLQRESTE
ncbi:sensor histidine kinase [Microbacterium sp. bgisy189]|uniref:sensor histidine kinase n=1 Tax=Microbacterium sp. bgisy189 TaxID=3413798 RepID=UPI003EBCBBE5